MADPPEALVRTLQSRHGVVTRGELVHMLNGTDHLADDRLRGGWFVRITAGMLRDAREQTLERIRQTFEARKRAFGY